MLALQSYLDQLANELESGAVADGTALDPAKSEFLSKLLRLTMEAIEDDLFPTQRAPKIPV